MCLLWALVRRSRSHQAPRVRAIYMCCLGLYIVPLSINCGHHRKTKGNKSSFVQCQSNQCILVSNYRETVNSSDNLASVKRRIYQILKTEWVMCPSGSICWVSGPLYLETQAYPFKWFLRWGVSSAQCAGCPGKGLYTRRKVCLFLTNSAVPPYSQNNL